MSTLKRSGTIYGQVLNVGTGIVSGRILSFINTLLAIAIFGQEVFGYLAVFIAITSIISSANLLTLDKILPNFEDGIARVIVIALCFQVIITAAIPILLAPLFDWQYSGYMAIQILATGLTSIGLALNIRSKRFGWISIIEVLPVFVFFVFLGICWWLDIKDPEWLLGGRSFSFLLAALIFSFFVIFPFIKKLKFQLRSLVSLYRTEKKFIAQVTFGNFCNRGAYYFPTILIAEYFGLEEAAQYGLMLQFCMVPVGMAESAISKVYHGHLASMVRSSASSKFDRSKFKFMLVGLAALFLATVNYVVPIFIERGLDGNWALAIELIHIMSPAFAAMILVSPLTVAFFVFKKGMIEMLNQAIWLFFVLLSIGIGIFFNSIHFGVFAFSFVTVIRFCILYFYAENSVLAWEKESDAISS